MNRITRTTAAGLVAGALLLAGCGSESDGASDGAAGQEASGATFEITDAWARTSPASAENGAAYFEITASEDDALVGAEVSTDIAAEAQIHEVVMAEDGMGDDDMNMEGDDAGDDMSDEEMTDDQMSDDRNETGDDAEATDDSGDDSDATGDDDMNMEGDDAGDDMDMGNMTMQEVESIEFPAGETVVFEPGGYHVMLLGLVEPLEVGDTFDVTLLFESGAEQTVTVEVREG